MSIITPIPIDPAPPVPDSSVAEPAFDAQFEASLRWQKDEMTPKANALAQATYENAIAAAQSATESDDAKSDAEGYAVAANTAREQSEEARNDAQTAAAAAGAAAGLPSMAGKAGLRLRVKSDATGVEWGENELPAFAGNALKALRVNSTESGVEWAGADGETGDILISIDPNRYPAPDYLPCDGSTYLRSSYPGLSALTPELEWGGAPKLLDLPGQTSPGNAAAYSPDGNYLAVVSAGGGSGPYLHLYKRAGDTYTRLTNPAYMPTGATYSLAWTPDSNYLAITTDSTSDPLVIYKRAGDVFTRLVFSHGVASAGMAVCSISPDGALLVMSSNSVFAMYSLNGDVITKLANPASPPLGGSIELAWSPDSQQLFASSSASNDGIKTYSRSGNTLTATGQIGKVSGDTARRFAISDDGQYLCITYSASMSIEIYKWVGGAYERVIGAVTYNPGQVVNRVKFSRDSQHLVLAMDAAPFAKVLRRTGDTFNAINDLAGATSVVRNIDFSPDDTHLALVGGSTPGTWSSIYKARTDVFRVPQISNLPGSYIKA